MGTLTGRRSLVTGASRGIGRAVALRLAAEGSDIVAAARSKAELETLKAEIEHLGRNCLAIETDLRRPESVMRLAEAALADSTQIDILVNNAGVGVWGELGEISLEQYDEVFDVNIRAVFLLTQAILPSMTARGNGFVVNIGSTSGRCGYSGGTVYCASKFALTGFADALAKELQPKGIRVCTIFPGSVNTYLGGSGPEGWDADMLAPEDVAESVVHVVTTPSRVFTTEIVVWPKGEVIL